MTRSVAARKRDALLGLLVGDALGVPFEFKPAGAIPAGANIHMRRFVVTMTKTYASVPLGYWSDDGALMLCLADALTRAPACSRHYDSRTIQLRRFRENAIAWFSRGKFACKRNRFDIGNRTAAAIGAWRRGENPTPPVEGEGNGALMSVLPIALDERLIVIERIGLAAAHSRQTHGPLSAMACSAYVFIAATLLHDNRLVTIAEALDAVAFHFPPGTRLLFEARLAVAVPGGGHAVDTLLNAIRALRGASSFEEAVKNAIRLGGDTDTTAAVTGGLAALHFGPAPRHWVVGLQDRASAEKIIARFVKASGRR